MKRNLLISLAAIAAVSFLFSCQKELSFNEQTIEEQTDPNKVKESAIMTVNAGEPQTKTYLEADGDNYNVFWSAGDRIAAFEVGNGVVASDKTASSELDAAGASASFTMDFSGNTTLTPNYSYLFVYPAGALGKNGVIYRSRIKWDQTFSATSFDKDADLLISEAVSDQDTRPTSVNVGFARVGATVLMNLKAPTTSETIQSIEFSTTEGNIAGYIKVYPTTGTYDTDIYSGYKQINLTPATATTYTGIIPVWFRCAAIDLSNNFTVTVHTTGKSYTKTVDLAAAGKTIKFENAALTKINVDMTSAASYVRFNVGTEITSIFPATKAGVKFLNEKGSGSTDPFYGSPYNWYKNSTITISGGTTGSISKVVISYESDGLDAENFESDDDDATYALVGKVGTWNVGTDPVTSVTFTNKTNKVTFSSIDVFFTGTPNETVVASTPSIAFADASFDVAAGSTRTNVAASNYNNGTITYSSLDESKATVNSSGVVTGVAAGVVTIRATITGASTPFSIINSNTADCTVTVTAPATYDVLNLDWTAIGTTSYTAWSGKEGSYSSAVYAGTSGGDKSSIQLNSGSPRGIISTTSGGTLSNVTVSWHVDTKAGNKLQVYGMNVPYAGSGDLASDAKHGTLIGELIKGTSTSLDVDGYYEYVGLYGSNGAIYLPEIRITWEDAKTRIGSPASFSASSTGDDITVTWVDVASGVSKYLVTCYGQPDQLINPGVQTATFEDLADGTYKVSIRAIPSDLSTYSYSTIQSDDVVVSAGPAALLTCDMTTASYGTSSYTGTLTYGNWTIKYGANNNKNWNYFKMGGSSSNLTDHNPCEICSTTSTSAAAASVVVHIPAGSLSKTGMSVTSWGVEVYNNSDYAAGHKIDTAKGGGTITKSEGTFTFYPSDAYQAANSRTTWPSGCYFKVTWTLANTTTTNGIVYVDKVTVYGE